MTSACSVVYLNTSQLSFTLNNNFKSGRSPASGCLITSGESLDVIFCEDIHAGRSIICVNILMTALSFKIITHKAPIQYKDRLFQVWDSHVKDKTVARPSYR